MNCCEHRLTGIVSSVFENRFRTGISRTLLILLLTLSGSLPAVPAAGPQSDEASSDAADEQQATDEQKADGEQKAADEQQAADQDAVPEGHSFHGEAFNEGPRQAAQLIDGVGRVQFPVTTDSDEARQFITQGVGQLHGFWYFESERSFRQAAQFDPECAMAYWGMAMSNRSNADRAKGFISEAVERKDQATRREQLYIEAFDRYINADAGSSDDRRKRAERYIRDLDELLQEFPEDIEAKAFLCEFFWSSRRDNVRALSYTAVDAMIEDILEVEPLHPVHHYRIHLWDTKKPKNALQSAARCGPSAPAIAHMWHMPGHIYSRLKRYHDAVWQQEASARTDHAHMMKFRVLPDQIHNFAHNNEWCIRNLIAIGRIHDALALSQNMISLPRHPKYNHLDRYGSYKYGRQRLLQVLRDCELHEALLTLSETEWLSPVGDEDMDFERTRAIGAAAAATGRVETARGIRDDLAARLDEQKAKQSAAGDKAAEEAKAEEKDEKAIAAARRSAENKFRSDIRDLENAVNEIDGRLADRNGEYEAAVEHLKEARGVSVVYQVAVMRRAGQLDDAVKRIADHVDSNRGEVLPLAAQVVTLWEAGQQDEARTAFEKLQALSQDLDLDVPAFAAVTPIARELGHPADWRTPRTPADDVAVRPDLDSLGPFRWQPMAAPDWELADVNNERVRLHKFRGRPMVLIFYLGYGCLHCAEQLQAFDPKYEEFRNAGFEVVAISTDSQEHLSRASDDLDKPLSIPLLADDQMTVFRRYRCYDDFEDQPLHGTFVIDARGRIRWQDISYEPFMDPDYVLEEAQRLLSLDGAESADDPFQSVQVSGD